MHAVWPTLLPLGGFGTTGAQRDTAKPTWGKETCEVVDACVLMQHLQASRCQQSGMLDGLCCAGIDFFVAQVKHTSSLATCSDCAISAVVGRVQKRGCTGGERCRCSLQTPCKLSCKALTASTTIRTAELECGCWVQAYPHSSCAGWKGLWGQLWRLVVTAKPTCMRGNHHHSVARSRALLCGAWSLAQPLTAPAVLLQPVYGARKPA